MLRLTRSQIREIDLQAVERYNIPSIVLMENAARVVADAACEMLDNKCAGEVLILCGAGHNAGDGFAAARHLANRGADVTIALLNDPGSFEGDTLVNWEIVRAMNLLTIPASPELLAADRVAMLIIDAIFGIGLNRPPVEPFPALAKAVAESARPVLAVDVPSGLDCDTGTAPGVAIRATRTVTFVAEKVGFVKASARQYLGRVTVADIGVPRQLIDEVARAKME
jgi:NAD(P)H-hydrate epimerase